MTVVAVNEPWLGEVPGDWQVSRIRNVAQLSPGYSGGPPTDGEPCTFVPMERLSESGSIDLSEVLPFADISSGLTVFESGDVIFAKITPCMENGKGALVDGLPTRYGFGSTEFHVLRPRHALHSKFLYYYTFNPVYRAYAAENMSGAAGQKRVSSRFLKDTRLFLPSVHEQELIAAYLDASCGTIDAAVTSKRRQIEILMKLEDSLIHDLVSGRRRVAPGSGSESTRSAPNHESDATLRSIFGNSPEGWSVDRIRDLLGPIVGGDWGEDPAESDDGAVIAVIRVADIRGLDISGGNLTVRRVKLSKLATRLVGDRTVLLEKSGGGQQSPVGRAVHPRNLDCDAICSNFMAKADCRHNLDPRFLVYLLHALYTTGVNTAHIQQTTGIQNLRVFDYLNTCVAFPPLDEQARIVKEIDDSHVAYSTLKDVIERQIDGLISYRKSLIHECVTGQRRVTEADLNRAQSHG